jgi:hypothetical protein
VLLNVVVAIKTACPESRHETQQLVNTTKEMVERALAKWQVSEAHKTERVLLQEHLLPLGVDLELCLSFLSDAAEWASAFH